jgi:hypothetical protein
MYIDPGSGSMLVQVLIASALGSLITFRKFFTGLFSRPKPKPSDSSAPENH